MSKVLLFTDIHVHTHKQSSERLNDCLKVLDWVLRTAVEQKVNHVLFLGDLFHDKQKIDVFTYQKTFEIFEKHMGDNPPFKVYLVLGNHDLWHLSKWDISSVIPFGSINGITVIDRPCTLNLDGSQVSFLPYTNTPIDDIKNLLKSNNNILCAHLAIDGAVLNVRAGTKAEVSVEHDDDLIKVGPEILKGWNNVFLGHYHSYQQIDKHIEYIGSPLQLSFGEAFTHKHVLIFDLETKEKQYIRNTFSPQHFIISEKDLDKYELNGNFIKVMVDDLSESDVMEIRSEIMSKNKPGSLEIRQVEREVDEKIVEESKAILLKKSEMLEKWVETLNEAKLLGDLDKQKLLSIGQSICSNCQIIS